MIAEVKIYYAKNIRVILQGRTFSQAMELIWQTEPFSQYSPLKMVLTATGKVLYLDKTAFSKYISGEITQQDLIGLTQCDEVYRNKHQITTSDFYTVDAGKMWKLKQKTLHLAENEQIETPFDLQVFELVE